MIRLCCFKDNIQEILFLILTIIRLKFISTENQYDSIEYLANLNNTNQNVNNSEYHDGYFIFHTEFKYEQQHRNFKESSIYNDNVSSFNDRINIQSSAFCNDTLFKCIGLSIILGLLIICTIIGNSFVIAAVILERNLHNLGNYLIVSLAFSDLTVAIMVMPIGAYQEVARYWSLGKIICDIWTSFDVLSCTASILHLVAIALDRYMAITNLDYGAKRTIKRFVCTILIIWTVSAITAVSPHMFGLSFDETNNQRCQLTNNFTYQLFSTLAAFYLPLAIMCIIYWKIFQAAKFRIRKKGFSGGQAGAGGNHNHSSEKTKANKMIKSDKNKQKTNLTSQTNNNNNNQIKKSESLVKSKSNNSFKKEKIELIENKNNIKLTSINNNENNLKREDKFMAHENSESEVNLEMRKESRAKRQESRDQDSYCESDDSSIISIRNELIRNKERKEQMKQKQLELQQSTQTSKIKKIIFKNKFLFKNLYILQNKNTNQTNQIGLTTSNSKLDCDKYNKTSSMENEKTDKHIIQKSVSLKENLSNTIKNDKVFLNLNNSLPIKSFDNLILNNDDNIDDNHIIQLNSNNFEKKLRFKTNEPENKIENHIELPAPIIYNKFSLRPQKMVYLFDDTLSFCRDISSPLDPETSIIMFKDFSFSDQVSLNGKIPCVYPECDILSNSNLSVENADISNKQYDTNDDSKKTNEITEFIVTNMSDNNKNNSVQSVPNDSAKDTEVKLLKNDKLSIEIKPKESLAVNVNNMNSGSNLNINRVNSVKRPSDINSVLKRKAKIDIKRERKAAKTLGVIMSCFIMCWLPFFLMQILFSFCEDCQITRIIEKTPLITILTWSGYLNSLLNPIIYTIFSPDFRSAFAKILFGRYNKRRRSNQK